MRRIVTGVPATLLAALLGLAVGVPGPARAQTALERGKYLVESIVGCGNCHTPQGPDGPLTNRALSGGPPIDEPNLFTAFPANITPDPATGIGRWTDAQLKLAIREGKRPDGSLIGPPMPFYYYRHISDADLNAIVAYLRSVPAIDNKVAKSNYRMPLPPAYGPPIAEPVTAPAKTDQVAYGAYLAGPLGHCLECHTPMGPNGIMYDTQLGAGGFAFHGPWGTNVSRNITSDREMGLGTWSDAEIERAVRTGIGKDGRKLLPPMGYGYYAKISAEDMGALIAYLRTLPPKKTP
jgi:mono/diheme cytochrome c family protein